MLKQPPRRELERVEFESARNPGHETWTGRLLQRPYRFPFSGESDKDFSVQIDHRGTAHYFPLGTPERDAAAAKAMQIHEMVVNDGWDVVRERFPRELIVSFEWCANPLLWTYTTIHTLVGKRNGAKFLSMPPNDRKQQVLIVEPDAGIRQALCRCIDEQPGYAGIPCDSIEAYSQMLALRNPGLVMLNRNLAGQIDLKSAGTISHVRKNVPALTYSVHADGDKMFASTPGGVTGYLIKRVKPGSLLEPIKKVANRPEPAAQEFLLRVKNYFQDSLQSCFGRDNSVLAKLTQREREALELLSKGLVDKEIAQAMGISAWTVHGHIKNIFERLNVRTRTEAVIRYFER